MPLKRTFIAIKIPVKKELNALLDNVQHELKSEKIKWVDRWNLHLTLFFLGDTKEEIIPSIKNELTSMAVGFKPTELVLKGLGVFKNIQYPRVLWIGLDKNVTLQKWKHEIDQKMLNYGFSPDHKTFNPHLTIARMKYIKSPESIINIINGHKQKIIDSFSVDTLYFYESILKPSGPVYQPLSIIKLADSDPPTLDNGEHGID